MRANARAFDNFGGHSGGGTPLPIPNREVKPASADGTRGASPRESRTPPNSLNARLVRAFVFLDSRRGAPRRRWPPPRARRAHASLLLDARPLGVPPLRARAGAARAPGAAGRLARGRQPAHHLDRGRRNRGRNRRRSIRGAGRASRRLLGCRRRDRVRGALARGGGHPRRDVAGCRAARDRRGARRHDASGGARRSPRTVGACGARRGERHRDGARSPGALRGRGGDLGRLGLACGLRRGRAARSPRDGDRVRLGLLPGRAGAPA